MARWDLYDPLVTLLGELTLLGRDDGQANPGDEIRTLTVTKLAEFLIAEGSLDTHFDAQYQRTTAIEGLRLLWNSTTSITVDVGVCYAQNGDLINVTSQLVKSSLSLSASTWYHVYVYLSAGVPAAEVVTTAPTAWKGTAYSKTGDTSRRYVGSILTDGSGNVKAFIHNPQTNYFGYTNHRSDATPHRVLSAGTATTATAVGLTGIIPVTAFFVYIRIISSADKVMYTGENNSVSSTQNTVALNLGNTAVQNAFMIHPFDSSQQIWYLFASAVGAGSGSMDVAGFFFRR